MNFKLTVPRSLHWSRRNLGTKKVRAGRQPSVAPGRVPRIARLMALALHCEKMIREETIADQTELATLGQISKSRMTQIMSLLNLATDIQEAILFLPLTPNGRDVINDAEIRPIAATIDWKVQRKMWQSLMMAVQIGSQ